MSYLWADAIAQIVVAVWAASVWVVIIEIGKCEVHKPRNPDGGS